MFGTHISPWSRDDDRHVHTAACHDGVWTLTSTIDPTSTATYPIATTWAGAHMLLMWQLTRVAPCPRLLTWLDLRFAAQGIVGNTPLSWCGDTLCRLRSELLAAASHGDFDAGWERAVRAAEAAALRCRTTPGACEAVARHEVRRP